MTIDDGEFDRVMAEGLPRARRFLFGERQLLAAALINHCRVLAQYAILADADEAQMLEEADALARRLLTEFLR